jgi:two-component system catabolic regulation response regulator CreB
MLNKPRILVVEDESAIADTIQYVLGNDGFVPVWCSTAQEAIASFAGERPALAILDVGLPDLNGFQLFKELQALPGGAEVPMLFLTARSDEIDRVVGLELGADDYIAKPFSPRELLARVRAILRRSARPPVAAAEPPPQPFHLDEERHRIRYYGCPLELSRYEYGILRTLLLKPGPRVHARRAAGQGLGRCQRELRPHGRCPHQDPARQAEGGGARGGGDPHAAWHRLCPQ